MNYKRLIIVALVILLVSIGFDALAQCSMCQAVVESSQQNNEKSFGLGLNNAILYLMAMPYLLIGIIGFMLYRHHKAKATAN